MGILDYLFGRSPPAPRPAPKVSVRRYDAARPANIAGGFSAAGGLRSPYDNIRWDLRGLIAHSRQQAENNDYMKSWLDAVVRNVIGHQGVRLQNEARDTNGSLDKVANGIIEEGWSRWGRLGTPTVDGGLSWIDMQSLVVRTVARDGAILVRRYRGRAFGPFAYQQQLLEIDYLDTDLNIELPNGTVVRMGVEFDSFNRPQAYHIFARHPSETGGRRSTARTRVPADQIFLLMRPERAGQIVGVPGSYTALRRLNMTHGYEEAAITAARVGAAKMGFLEQDPDAIPSDPKDIEQEETTDTGHIIREVEAGIIEKLPPGYSYKEHNPAYPTGEFGAFMRTVLQGAAAGLGVSYATLANDLTGANFSSLRAGKGEERDEWRMWQRSIVEGYIDRTFRDWLPMALLVNALGNLPAGKIDKFEQPKWRPRGWAYVSPGEEANANQREMAAGLRSPQQIVGERGDDIDTVFEELAEARKLAESYGITFDPQPPGHETGGTPPPDPAA